MKVFISSVISGMEPFRDAVARAARSLGHQIIRAEDFGARADSPQAACLAGVREAEAVVLLVGARYGALQSSGLSATHEEYREARERCPVLIMVQEGIEREADQAAFLTEVQDWARGHYTQNFADAEQLRDAVTGALHNLELTRATGPVDPAEMLARCISLLPDEERGHGGGRPRLALALAGGPLHTVLRPAQLEARELGERLQQLALFGPAAIFSTRQGTETGIDGDALVLEQPDRSVAIDETGAIRFTAEIPHPDAGLSVILEEDVQDLIARFLRFASTVFDHIDPVGRLSHVVLAARILDTGYAAWRTRAEHARSPNNIEMNMSDGASEAVHLSPPHRTRSALRLNAAELVEDLTVKLRRELQNPPRNQW